MSYMRKDPTLVMTAVIAIVLLIFAGSAYFYHVNIKNFTTEINEKTNLVENLSQQLSDYITSLNETKEELEVKIEREEDLSTKYEDIKSEKETLETEKADLESDLSFANEAINDLNETLILKNQQIDNLNVEVISLESDVDDLQDEVSGLCDLVSANSLNTTIC